MGPLLEWVSGGARFIVVETRDAAARLIRWGLPRLTLIARYQLACSQGNGLSGSDDGGQRICQ